MLFSPLVLGLECRGDVTFPPSFGPSDGRGEAATSVFVPLCLGTPKNAGVS